MTAEGIAVRHQDAPPDACPMCEGVSLFRDEYQYAQSVSRVVTCNECGATWRVLFLYAGIEMLRLGGAYADSADL